MSEINNKAEKNYDKEIIRNHVELVNVLKFSYSLVTIYNKFRELNFVVLGLININFSFSKSFEYC